MTIFDIQLRNQQAGEFFFSTGAKRFFASRIGQTVYEGPGGIYFITSEQFRPPQGPPAPRRYTVRQAMPGGDIATIGPFNEYSRSTAHRKARALAQEKQP